jgi:hypothetical protein
LRVAEAALTWTFNPWRADWHRPTLVLAICLAVAVGFGYSMAVPNYSPELRTQYAEAARPGLDLDAEQAAGRLTAAETFQVKRARLALEQLDAQPARWRGHWLAWSGISLCFLLGMTLVLFTPVGYRLDERGVAVRFMGVSSFRPWEHYRNFYPHARVVHLTTMPRPSRLDPFRGHPLQFSGNRDAVLEYLGEHIARAGQQA